MAKPIYVAVEGMDYSGKSSLISAMVDLLGAENVMVTREPGGGVFGDAIRSLVVSDECPDNARLPLFIANRIVTVKQALDEAEAMNKKYVLSDRCFLSSAAMQNKYLGGSNLEPSEIVDLHQMLGVIFPDVIILNTTTPLEVAIKRNDSRTEGNDLDNWTLNNYETIRAKYNESMESIIDNDDMSTKLIRFACNRPLSKTAKEVCDEIQSYFKHILHQ